MFSSLSNLSKVVVFFCITIALSLLTISLIPGEGVVLINMFTPLAATLVMLLVVTSEGYKVEGWASLGLHRAGFRGWGLALLLPLPIFFFNYGLIWLMGLGTLVAPDGDITRLLFRLPIGLAIGTLFVLGEEVGFRGYALPRLLGLGRQQAVLISGLLHAVWHLPLIFLTPYYHSEGSPLIVTPLFLLTLTVAGIIYGYLRLTYDSLWPSAILHRAVNLYWSVFAAFTLTTSPLATEYLGGESGLLTLLPTTILAGWCLMRLRPRSGLRPAAVTGSKRLSQIKTGD